MGTELQGKHLITLETWTKSEIDIVLERAYDLKQRFARSESTELLKYKTLFMIFFEQSTRTRNSLEAGMTQLGGHAHDLTADKMQLAHGESPKDTAKVLSRMGEGISIRNCFYGVGNDYLTAIAEHADIPVLSMQDDVYHPLQAIADLMTLQEYYGSNVAGLKVAISWAYATSHAKPLSVPQSQILLFARYGINVVLGCPEKFPLQSEIVAQARENAAAHGGGLTIVHDMDNAIRGADVIIPKNWGGFADCASYTDDEAHRTELRNNLERHRDWICDRRRYSLANKGATILHALPADRGKEVTDEVLDSQYSLIYDEAENRLHTAKSLLSLMLGGRV